MKEKSNSCGDGNITGVVKNLGLDQYWLDSYRVKSFALIMAKRSLVETTYFL